MNNISYLFKKIGNHVTPLNGPKMEKALSLLQESALIVEHIESLVL
jgi:hypothetical protein